MQNGRQGHLEIQCGTSRRLVHRAVVLNKSTYLSELYGKHAECQPNGAFGRECRQVLEIYQRNLDEKELDAYLVWLHTQSFQLVIPLFQTNRNNPWLYSVLNLFLFAVKRDRPQNKSANSPGEHMDLIENLIRYILDGFTRMILLSISNLRNQAAFVLDMRHELEYLFGMDADINGSGNSSIAVLQISVAEQIAVHKNLLLDVMGEEYYKLIKGAPRLVKLLNTLFSQS